MPWMTSFRTPTTPSLGQVDHVSRMEPSLAARVFRELWQTTKATLFYSYTNLLLFCIPLGIIARQREWDDQYVFVINFMAMFPLASILTFSTEQLAAEVGPIVGGLINATFGNAVEMIVGVPSLDASCRVLRC
jgi:Ca2+:H+ antiporter